MTAIADAPLLRLRLEHLLATADVEPRSLPPAAIFIVRHLADPAPHRLLSESQSVRAPAVWQDAARDRLDDLYRQAAYPADGPVPWSAPAVVFRDRAELIACLTIDLLRDDERRWWWKSFLRSLPRPSTVPPLAVLWRQEIGRLPAILSVLERSGFAPAALSHISPSEAEALAQEMMQATGLTSPWATQPIALADRAAPLEEQLQVPDKLEPELDGIESRRSSSIPVRQTASAGGTDPSTAHPPVALAAASTPVMRRLSASPPWHHVIETQSILLTLGPERAALLTLAVLIHRAPGAFSDRQFARAFRSWFSTGPDLRPDCIPESTPDSPRPAQVTPVGRKQPHSVPTPTPEIAILRRPTGELPDAPQRPGAARPGISPTARTAHAPVAPALMSAVRAAQTPTTPATDRERARLVLPATGEILTGIGGVLFLINLFHRLKIPDSFHDLFGIDWPVSGWRLLELIALPLCDESLQDDPLWPVFEILDENQQAEFQGGPPYVVPSSWPAVAFAPSTPIEAGPEPFVDFLVSYFRPLLLSLLTLPAGASLTDELFRRAGRVYVTSSHVDLVMPIELATIPVRMSGLDANPGWAPAFGRVITFHYT